MTLQKCLVRQANQHFSLLFLKQMILISPSGDIFSLVFSITQSRFICISDGTKWLALLWCVSRQLMLVSKTTTTIIIIRTVQQTISTISTINRISMKRIWEFHNWRTKREAEKQRLFFCERMQSVGWGSVVMYLCTASLQWHARSHTHVCMSTHAADTQAMKETPSKNNWISVRGIKILPSQHGIYLLSDSLCKSSLIYILDRLDVSSICFKTYICVKWMTL